MNLGKLLKVVVIPERVPARQPVPAPPETRPEPLIPLPAAWPSLTGHHELSMPAAATRAFGVPLIDDSAAERLIESQRESMAVP